MPDLLRISIEGNPLRSIKPSMRTANAVQWKKYLKLRLEESEVNAEENKQDQIKNMPGATQQYDHWQTLLREFLQGTQLDLRGK